MDSGAYSDLLEFDLKNTKKEPKKEPVKKNPTVDKSNKKTTDNKVTPKPSFSKPAKKEEPEVMEFPSDPDVPCRQFGDLYCKVCDSHMNSEQMWENHISGKRHIKNSRKGGSDSGEQKYEYTSEEATIQKDLDRETRPIAGLEHICEIKRIDQGPLYQCFLCSASLTTPKLLMEHIMGLKHQLAFLKEHDKQAFSLVDTSSLSKPMLEPIVQDLMAKYQQKHGKGKIAVKKEKAKSGSSSSYKRSADDVKKASSKPSKTSSASSNAATKSSRLSSRYSPPSKSSRRLSPPPTKPARYSSPPPPRFARYPSPPSLRSDRYNSPPLSRSDRYSSPPRSDRFRHSESEWAKVPIPGERSRGYSDEDSWTRIDPEPRPYRSHEDFGSSLEGAAGYSRPWPSECSDLRTVLEQKKTLGITSASSRSNPIAVKDVPAKARITDVSEKLLELVEDMTPQVFLRVALFKLETMDASDIENDTEIKLLERVTAKLVEIGKKLPTKDLKAKYVETLAQNGIPTQSSSSSTVDNQQFSQTLNNFIEHYKAQKTTAYDDAPSQEPYMNSSDDHYNSTTFRRTPERPSASSERPSVSDSAWNLRPSISPFLSFSSDPTCIPGLTLTENPPPQPSVSAPMSQLAQTAKSYFGEINVPTTSSVSYPTQDYNRLSYRY